MAMIPKLIRFNIISVKILAYFFVEIYKLIIYKCKGSRIAKRILKQKNRAVGLTTSDLETYYEAAVIKTGWHWHKEDVGQWNKIGSTEIGP